VRVWSLEGELLGIRPTTTYHCILSFDLDTRDQDGHGHIRRAQLDWLTAGEPD